MVFQEAVCALNQCPKYGAVCPIARIHRSRNQGVGTGVTPLIITPSGPVASFLLSVPMTLRSAGLEVFISKGGMLRPEGITMMPLTRKFIRPPGHFGFCMPLESKDNG